MLVHQDFHITKCAPYLHSSRPFGSPVPGSIGSQSQKAMSDCIHAFQINIFMGNHRCALAPDLT